MGMQKVPKGRMSLAEKIDRFFHISARNSTIGTECMSGTTTFMNMIYIVPVSSVMFAAAGVDQTLAALAITIVTAIVSMAMGFVANLPISLSTGMGLNAFACYAVCLGMRIPYDLIMWCVALEGVGFVIITLTGVRSALIKAIPHNMKMLIGAGIGLFIMYIGMQNTHLIVGDASTLTTLVNFKAEFHTQGISALLAVIGLTIILILSASRRKIAKAALIISILVTWLLGIICQATGIYIPDPTAGYYSLYPSLTAPHVASWGGMFMTTAALSSMNAGIIIDLIIVSFTMFYSDFFDTIGTCMSCMEAIKLQMREEIERMRKEIGEARAVYKEKVALMETELDDIGSEKTTKRALLVDAFGTILGAIFKCTTITSFVESIAGIESGGRTGLTAIVTGLWFALAVFAASIFTSVPGFATGAALIYVGYSMLTAGLKQVKWDSEAYEIAPCVLCAVFMAFSYNIANGMAVGIIMYVIIGICTGHRRDVNPIFYVFSILLLAKFYFL